MFFLFCSWFKDGWVVVVVVEDWFYDLVLLCFVGLVLFVFEFDVWMELWLG